MSDPPVLRLTLRDGHPVALRPVVPSDRDRLAAGFAQLSADSRRLRFLGSVSTLSDAHLRYLTEIDRQGVISAPEPERTAMAMGFFMPRLLGVTTTPPSDDEITAHLDAVVPAFLDGIRRR